MAKKGAPTKIGPVEMEKAYACLSLGCSLRDVAAELGVDYKTIWNARKKYPTFSKGVNRAIQKGKKHHLTKIRKARQWQASAWYLERRHGEQFGRKDVREVRSKRIVKHEVRHTIDYDQLARDLDTIARGGVPANGNGKPVHSRHADKAAGEVPGLARS